MIVVVVVMLCGITYGIGRLVTQDERFQAGAELEKREFISKLREGIAIGRPFTIPGIKMTFTPTGDDVMISGAAVKYSYCEACHGGLNGKK
jgi:hypothetical protein